MTSVFKRNASFRLRLEQAGKSHMEVTGGLEHPDRVNTSSPQDWGDLSQAHWPGRSRGRELQRAAKLRSPEPLPLTCCGSD